METALNAKPAAQPEPTRGLIVQAAKALASVCDGANDRDGVGYNGVDSRIMRDLAVQGRHTDRQLRTMWHILRKYKVQLEACGISYDAVVPPPMPPRDAAGRFQVAPDRVRMTLVETGAGPMIAVIFGYNVNLVEIIRQVEGRRFDKENRRWLIPANADALGNALAGFEAVEPALAIEVAPQVAQHAEADRQARRTSFEASRKATSNLQVPTKLPLLPFQSAGVEYIDAHGGRALVADEMGLGKTAQAIGWLALRKEKALPALVVAPAVVRVNWLREITKFSDLKAMIVVSKTALKGFRKLGIPVSDKPEPGYDIVITNYDLCRNPNNQATINGIPLSKWANFKTVIMDEAHAIKEPKSQRTKVMLRLSMVIPHVILLTGTPLLNRPKEIWTLTQACNPSVFPKFFPFALRYCDARKDRFGWNFDGATKIEELAKLLRERVMVRREKMDVLKELPDRRRVTFPISMNGHLDEYQKEVAPILESLAQLRKERDDWKRNMESMSEAERRTFLSTHAEEKAKTAKIAGGIVGEIAKMRKVAGLSKIEPAVDFVIDTVEQVGKVIVFCHHHDVIDALTERLRGHYGKVRRPESETVRQVGRYTASSEPKQIDNVDLPLSMRDGEVRSVRYADTTKVDGMSKLPADETRSGEERRLPTVGCSKESGEETENSVYDKLDGRHDPKEMSSLRDTSEVEQQDAGLRKPVAGQDQPENGIHEKERVGDQLESERNQARRQPQGVGTVGSKFKGETVVVLDGRTSTTDRQSAIDAFQNGEAKVIVMSIAAGGVGINLQSASNVIFVELPWRPGDVDQAEARAWRMGQKNSVTTYFLVGLGTIEESIAKILDAKREVTNAVVDEADRTVEEDGILDAILNGLLPEVTR